MKKIRKEIDAILKKEEIFEEMIGVLGHMHGNVDSCQKCGNELIGYAEINKNLDKSTQKYTKFCIFCDDLPMIG